MVNGKPGMNHHHHRDCGSDNDLDGDPSRWNRASYNHHPCDDFEPLPDVSNPYREAAIYHLKLMFAVDEFCAAAQDARLAVIAVAVTLGWPSVRGLTIGDIADQTGCTPSALIRSIARFKTLAGLDSNGGGMTCTAFELSRRRDNVRSIGNGAGSNGDKPAAVQS
jgi:hypothetical protein